MAGIKDPITDTQRAAARALIEGEAPTHGRIAACMGVNVTTVSHWASEDSWASLDFRHPRVKKAHRGMIALARALREGEEADPLSELGEIERDAIAAAGLDETADVPADPDAAALNELASLPHGDRAARIGSILTGRIEKVLIAVEAGRVVETRQVLALNALVQLAERITAMTPEDKRDAAIKSDEEVAELYERIERKIAVQALYFCRQVIERRFGLAREEADELIPVDPNDPCVLAAGDGPARRVILLPQEEAGPPALTVSGDSKSTSLI